MTMQAQKLGLLMKRFEPQDVDHIGAFGPADRDPKTKTKTRDDHDLGGRNLSKTRSYDRVISFFEGQVGEKSWLSMAAKAALYDRRMLIPQW